MSQVTVNGVVYHILQAGAAAPPGTQAVPGPQLMGLAQAIATAAANNQSAVIEIANWGVDVVGRLDDVAFSIKNAIHNGTLVVFR